MVEQFMDIISYKWGKIEMSIIYSSILAVYNILSYVFLIITVNILCTISY